MKIYKTSPEGKPVEKKPEQAQLIVVKKGVTANGRSTKIKTLNIRD